MSTQTVRIGPILNLHNEAPCEICGLETGMLYELETAKRRCWAVIIIGLCVAQQVEIWRGL